MIEDLSLDAVIPSCRRPDASKHQRLPSDLPADQVNAGEAAGTEGVAYDIGSKDAPPGIRIWGGATVEQGDLEALAVAGLGPSK